MTKKKNRKKRMAKRNMGRKKPVVVSGRVYDLQAVIARAEKFAQNGEIQKAAETAVRGLERFPNSANMLSTAGYVHEMAGQVAEARECHETALRIDPDSVHSLQHFSRFLIRQGRWGESVQCLDHLAELTPKDHWIYLALGSCHMYLKNLDQAKTLIQKSIHLNPNDPRAWVNLGNTLRFRREFREAERVLKKALAMRRSVDVLVALSSLFTDMGDFNKGIRYAEKVLATAGPLSAETLKSAAYPFMKTGNYEKAEELYRMALELEPGHAESGFGLASALLVQGRLKEAWPIYRARFDVMQTWLDAPWPVWNGEDIKGKTLYICGEQGAGDSIQFARFIPFLKQLGINVLFSFQPSLGRLFQCLEEHAELLPYRKINISSNDADFQTALLELPGLLNVDKVEDIPAHVPYLSVSDEIVREWEKLTADAECYFKVGLVWAGNPNHVNDHNRSIRLSMLEPLGKIPGLKLFSLQVGDASAEIEECRDILDLVDLTHHISDFADTAGLIENLDLVVSVDTATAHLAGALGKPVIILLPFSPDWRWFLEREDSPWYPTARLLRQPSPGEWEPVIEKLCVLLNEWKDRGRA